MTDDRGARWRATIVYDADGTKRRRVEGVEVSTQIFGDAEPTVKGGRPGRVEVRDAEGEIVRVIQVSACYVIDKERIRPPAESVTEETASDPA